MVGASRRGICGLVRPGDRAVAVAERLSRSLAMRSRSLPVAHAVALAQRLVACSDGLLVCSRSLIARAKRLREATDGGVAAVQRRRPPRPSRPRAGRAWSAGARSRAGPETGARQGRPHRRARAAVEGGSGTRGASRCASRPSSHRVADRPSRLGPEPLPDPGAGRPSRRAPRKLSRRSSRLGRALIRCSLAAEPGVGSMTVMSGATVSSILPGSAPSRSIGNAASHSSPSWAAHGLCSRSASARWRLSPVPSVSVGRTNLRPRKPNHRPDSASWPPPRGSNRSTSKLTLPAPRSGSTACAITVSLPHIGESVHTRARACRPGLRSGANS